MLNQRLRSLSGSSSSEAPVRASKASTSRSSPSPAPKNRMRSATYQAWRVSPNSTMSSSASSSTAPAWSSMADRIHRLTHLRGVGGVGGRRNGGRRVAEDRGAPVRAGSGGAVRGRVAVDVTGARTSMRRASAQRPSPELHGGDSNGAERACIEGTNRRVATFERRREHARNSADGRRAGAPLSGILVPWLNERSPPTTS